VKNNHYSQPTPHTNETLGELDELANHRLLHAFGCPANCSGAQAAALFFWQILDANAEIFQSYRVKDWISEVQQLSERIAALQNPTLGAPSSEARKLNPWGTLLKCRPSQCPGQVLSNVTTNRGTPLATFAQHEEEIWTAHLASETLGNIGKPRISNSRIFRFPESAGRGLFHTSRTRSSRPAWASTRRGSYRTRKTIGKNPSTWSRSWHVRNAGSQS
jgi:hypothetical protein